MFAFIDIQKWLKRKIYLQCFMENLKMKRKRTGDLSEEGFKPQIFSNFPAHDLNFHGR